MGLLLLCFLLYIFPVVAEVQVGRNIEAAVCDKQNCPSRESMQPLSFPLPALEYERYDSKKNTCEVQFTRRGRNSQEGGTSLVPYNFSNQILRREGSSSGIQEIGLRIDKNTEAFIPNSKPCYGYG